jgi:23S rRNA (guanosine2251-2'-O)-methyltransferase
MKTEIIYGMHPVMEALKARRRTCSEIYITPDRTPSHLSEVIETAKTLNLPIKSLSSSQLSILSGTEAHQGVGAKVSLFPLIEIEDMTDASAAGNLLTFLLLLDGIVDPQNMGALVRTALCAGVHGIVFPKDRSTSPLPSVSKASAGAMEHINMAMVTNLSAAIQELKHMGLWIAGLDKSAEKTLYDVDLTGPIAIVIGGEEKGIRPLVKQQCDFLVSIPQSVGFNSLNASVAGAVVMYEAVRQRMAQRR